MKRAAKKKAPARKVTRRSVVAQLAPVETVLVMRTCNARMEARGGFKWPASGPIAAPDWKPTVECGNGLHGLLWGEGDASLLNWDGSAKGLVVEVAKDSIVDLDGKVKFPRGVVVFCGTLHEAALFMSAKAPKGSAVVRGTATAGDSGTATAGYRGTATAGDSGTATAGDSGTATAGDSGTATAGYSGTATAGYSGTATAGHRGTAISGEIGIVVVRWLDESATPLRYRLAVGYVGEDGIKPNTKYRCDERGKLYEVVS